MDRNYGDVEEMIRVCEGSQDEKIEIIRGCEGDWKKKKHIQKRDEEDDKDTNFIITLKYNTFENSSLVFKLNPC